MDTLEDTPVAEETRRRVEDLHLAVAVDNEIVKARAQWWDPGMQAPWDAAKALPLQGLAAPIPAWAADQWRGA